MRLGRADMVFADYLDQSFIFVDQAFVVYGFRIIDSIDGFEDPEDLQQSV